MSEKLPTVKVANPANKRTGYKIINASAFDPKVHKLFDEAPATPAADAGATPAADAGAKSPLDALADLGEGWREAHGAKLKSIAAAISGRTPANKDEAVAIIDAELAKRAAAAAAAAPPAPGSVPPPPPPA